MIRWSFWVDPWEHPFNTWNRFYSALIPLASVEPALIAIEPLPPKEHVDFGPWKGPPPGPIKPGTPKPRQELKKWDFSIGFSIKQGAGKEGAKGIPKFNVNSPGKPKPDYSFIRIIGPDEKRSESTYDYDQWANPYYDQNTYYDDPHAIQIGPYTDETVPQIVKYI